jgi:hypothetical protein
MSLYKMFGTSKSVEQDGIILDYGDVRLRIARAGGANTAFKESFKQKIKPYKRQIDQKVMDDDVAMSLLAESYADTVILSWGTKQEDKDGAVTYSHTIADADGEQMEFNAANCTKLLIALPELFADVQEAANQASNYRTGEEKDNVKK